MSKENSGWTLDEWIKAKDTELEEIETPKEKTKDLQTITSEVVNEEVNKNFDQVYLQGLKTQLSEAIGGQSPIVKLEHDQKLVEKMNASEDVQKILLHTIISPGDIVTLTAAVRDLHRQYPGKFRVAVATNCPEIWEGNPYIEEFQIEVHDNEPVPVDKDVKVLKVDYPLVHECNGGAYHFIHGYAQDISQKLNIPNIKITEMKGDIHITDQEKSWVSQVHELLGDDYPYWIVDAGYKNDYTAKGWEFERYQKVVDALPEIFFVQIGAKEHNHPDLKGKNLINLVGQTDLRQLIRLVYHSYGVITPVSLPMHLAAAIEMHPRWNGRKYRPCIVIAGGREPSHWEAYSNHAYLHTCGMLPCCKEGGCWKSRTIPLDDGEEQDRSLCEHPILTPSQQYIPKCLDMIRAEDVIRKVCEYMSPGWDYIPRRNF